MAVCSIHIINHSKYHVFFIMTLLCALGYKSLNNNKSILFCKQNTIVIKKPFRLMIYC